MTKYAVKTTVYLQIESEVDGIGDAQHEVEWLIGQIKQKYALGPDGCEVSVARATDIEILNGELVESAGISVDKLWYCSDEKPHLLLDDGVR